MAPMDDYDSADIDADDEGENSFLPFEFCAGLSHNWRSLPMAQNDPKRLSDATVKIDQDSQALTGCCPRCAHASVIVWCYAFPHASACDLDRAEIRCFMMLPWHKRIKRGLWKTEIQEKNGKERLKWRIWDDFAPIHCHTSSCRKCLNVFELSLMTAL